ncbi:hypothetical protein, partial [Variovorax paradoxus]|uniref:hypothetical protein n=1 Tax=Variovorax paradoxus TaxID=34073 RepID=UPI001ABC77EF
MTLTGASGNVTGGADYDFTGGLVGRMQDGKIGRAAWRGRGVTLGGAACVVQRVAMCSLFLVLRIDWQFM